MIVYETYIWEVALEAGNTTGIKWSLFDKIGRFKFGVNVAGGADSNIGSPISIGLPTTGTVDFDVNDVFQFISSYGAVKTISQPQVTVLSGSAAKLRIADTQNYVASISRTTTDGGNTTVSTTTDSVDTGFTLNIGSNWDNATVYGTIDILLQEVQAIDTFDDNPDAVVQLPQTTERELNTQVRIRPGDLLLIAGLVRERDNYTKEGPGLTEPLIPTSRSASSNNSELVFLLRPRVIVFTSADSRTPRKGNVALPQTSFTQPTAPEVVNDVPPAPVAAVVPPAAVLTPMPEPVADEKPSEDLPVVKSPASSSIEIQPLSSVAPDAQKNQGANMDDGAVADPSVVVNYDVLGH
jgi:type II secretory pathway component GspD/PulD (secretin)